MSSASATFQAPLGISGAFKAFANEAYVLMSAMLNPGQVIEEVHQMRKLQLEADKIEASEPARAAALRRKAARIGMN
ncbi:hypothetical protein [Aquabacterium sp.]|uniref:hypothetical protein n=1 Tax=Aquabacterium sp. TaxID=1872578 RepID=UPI002BF3E905|nr:hypothetical protein [Aquabacterium sp.]HSW08911.1 hypothetical protein [Aquabacterium sp.]